MLVVSGPKAIQVDRNKHASRLYAASVGFVCVCATAFLFDIAVARFSQQDRVPGDLRRLLDFSEVFAHGAGVAMILLTAWTLDPANRRRLLRVAACAYGSGLMVDVLKPLIGRTRPSEFDIASLKSVWDTFAEPSPLLRGDWLAMFDHAHQSLPSGHTATAAGLAIGLSFMYPRGALLFGVFAVAAGLQRVAAGAHFPSDVAAGAAVGCFVGAVCHGAGRVGCFFDRWERRGAAGGNRPPAA